MSDLFVLPEGHTNKLWQKFCVPLSELNLVWGCIPEPTQLGIDVDEKYYDIRRLFYNRYAKQIVAFGDDPEDVLQEVYRGILIRNKGTCPYDPRKSAFSTYVMLVCHCIVSNHFKKNAPYFNNLKLQSPEEDEDTVSRIADVNGESYDDNLIDQIGEMFTGDFRRVFDMLLDGYKPKEISIQMGQTVPEIKRKIDHIRKKVAPKLAPHIKD